MQIKRMSQENHQNGKERMREKPERMEVYIPRKMCVSFSPTHPLFIPFISNWDARVLTLCLLMVTSGGRGAVNVSFLQVKSFLGKIISLTLVRLTHS